MWRLLLLELLVVALVGVIWFVGPLVGLTSPWVRVAVIASLLLPPGSLWLWGWWKARKASAGPKQSEESSEQTDLNHSDPGLPLKLRALKDGFEETVRSLKDASGTRGRAALYERPWYALVGPTGVGKSTALKNARLKFSLVTEHKTSMADRGETKTCDWLFTEDAVFADTAGRYAVANDGGSHEEWLTFLRLLARGRKTCPLNGLIVCVSLPDLLLSSPEESKWMARWLSQRMKEVFEQLRMVVPVYLLLTKCDRLTGFGELFGSLKGAAHDQPFGFALPAGMGSKERVEDVFEREYRALTSMVSEQASSLLGLVKRERRARVYQLSLELDAAAAPLKTWIGALFSSSAYHEGLWLRGVYLSSGIQSGTLVEQTRSWLAPAFGLSEFEEDAPAIVPSTHSYFLRDFFAKVLPRDAGLAEPSRARKKSYRQRHIVALALTVMVSVSVAGLALRSYLNNRALISSTIVLAEDCRRSTGHSSLEGQEALRALAAAAKRIDLLDRYHASGPPLSHGFGFYSGLSLREVLIRIFEGRMRTAFVEHVGIDLETILGQIADSPPCVPTEPPPPPRTSRAIMADYRALKAYRMLTKPERLDVEFLAPMVVEQWKTHLLPEVAKESDLLRSASATYLRLVKAGSARWLVSNETLVRQVQKCLRTEEPEYHGLLERGRREASDLTLKELLGGTFQEALHSKLRIDAAYTREAWERVIRADFKNSDRIERWILSDKRSQQGVLNDIRDRYLADYSAHWQMFLRGLSVQNGAGNAKEVLALLEALTAEPSLYEKLLARVVYEFAFPRMGDNFIKQTGPGEWGDDMNPAQQTFASLKELVFPPPGSNGAVPPSGLTQYRSQLEAIRDVMGPFSVAPKPNSGAIDEATERGRRLTDEIIKPLDVAMRSLVSPLLYGPILSAAFGAEKTQAEVVHDGFQAQVCGPFSARLQDHYPFSDSPSDARVEDVVDFFGPDGIAWTFYDEMLKERIIRKGQRYELRPKKKLAPKILHFYNRAAEITEALFPRNSGELGVGFDVRPYPAVSRGRQQGRHDVDQISLELGKQKNTYKNGSNERMWAYQWSGREKWARLVVHGRPNLRREYRARGAWAILRLLSPPVLHPKKDRLVAKWQLKDAGVDVKLDIVAKRTRNPFNTNLTLSCDG